MIDNENILKPFLTFSSPDDFYVASIIKRKKENPELGSNSYVAKTYYISSVKGFDFYYGEMKALCQYHNARAYINLNKRSFRKAAYKTLAKVTDVLLGVDYSNLKNAYSSVCSKEHADKNKKWLIDVDTADIDQLRPIYDSISQLRPAGDKVLATVPTKNGYHIITKPFHLLDFNKIYPYLEVKKNSPTLLMAP